MARYINLFTDFGFKRIFGSEENKDILLGFLNTLLADKQTIIDLHFLNTERLGNNSTDRKAIYDLYCENDKGEKFLVELHALSKNFSKNEAFFMQVAPSKNRPKRVLGTIIGRLFIPSLLWILSFRGRHTATSNPT